MTNFWDADGDFDYEAHYEAGQREKAAATAEGIVVVVVTQCVRGSVQPGAYATGRALLRAGAVPGFDMTSEAALTKLAVLLGQGLDVAAVADTMQRDVAGELSPNR